MNRSKRLAIYVTLLPDSQTVEWYAVSDHDDSGADLWNDGLCSSLSVPSAVAESLMDWLSEKTAERSPSGASTSS